MVTDQRRRAAAAFAAFSSTPLDELIRYNILDSGGVIPYQGMLDALADHGFDPVAELAGGTGYSPAGVKHRYTRKLT